MKDLTANKSNSDKPNNAESLVERMRREAGESAKTTKHATKNDKVTTPEPSPSDLMGKPSVQKPSRIVDADPIGDNVDDASEKDVRSLVPKNAVGKRIQNRIFKEVDNWEPPESLTNKDIKRFRKAALKVRFKDAIEDTMILEIGETLLEIKEKCDAGEFQKYVKDAMGIKPRSAQRYMKITREINDPTVVGKLGLKRCIEMLAETTPVSLRDAVFAAPTKERADKLIKDWKKDKKIEEAFADFDGNPIEKLGKELALSLSGEPVALRKAAMAKASQSEAEELFKEYKAAINEQGMPKERAASLVAYGTSDYMTTTSFANELKQQLDLIKKAPDKELSDEAKQKQAEIMQHILEWRKLIN